MPLQYLYIFIVVILGTAAFVEGHNYQQILSSAHAIVNERFRHNLSIMYRQMELSALESIRMPSLLTKRLVEAPSPKCEESLKIFAESLSRKQFWAIQWVDASGKPAAGITVGALTWPGNIGLCRNTTAIVANNSTTGQQMQGHYCDIAIPMPLPINLPVPFSIKIGLCVPDTCSSDDIIAIVNSTIAQLNLQVDPHTSFCHVDPSEVEKDSWFWIAVVLFGVLALLLCVTSISELVIWSLWKLYTCKMNRVDEDDGSEMKTKECMVDSMNKTTTVEPTKEFGQPVMNYQQYRAGLLRRSGVVLTIFMAYSLPYNSWKLYTSLPAQITDLNGKKGLHPLACLDGIRFITMNWIMFGHLLIVPLAVTNNFFQYFNQVQNQWTFQVIFAATLSVDTFFFMSGLLTCYLTIPLLKKVKTVLGFVKFWVVYVIHRFVRLTPPYMAVMIFYVGFFNHLYDGPMYPQKNSLSDIDACHKYWWTTYLNNLVHSKEICMGWTWYLSNDMQFSVVLAPIFMTLLLLSPYAGLAFLASLVISAFGSTFAISYKNSYSAGALLDGFDDIYVKPYTRWGTYAIGMFLGWLLREFPCMPYSRSRGRRYIFISSLMVISCFLALITVYGLYGSTSVQGHQLSVSDSAAYTALFRPAFIISVAIVVYLCAMKSLTPIRNLLTWSIFRIPARLTYGAYLVHIIVINFVSLGRQEPVMLDNLYLVVIYIGMAVLSYVAGFFVSMSCEAPVLAIEKFIRSYS